MNNDIKEYRTKGGKIRYKFSIYSGKNKANGWSKVIRKSGFKTIESADKAYREIKQAIKRGEFTPQKKQRLKFKEVYEQWLNYYATTVKESTLATTIRILERHVLPELGNYYIDQITVIKCQNAVNKWFKASPRTFKKYIRYSNDVFKYAEHLELINTSPMDKVIRPKFKDKEVKEFDQFYSKEELKRFLIFAKQYSLKAYAFFQILGYCGLRRGETIALKWSDIDFDNETLSVNRTTSKGLNNRILIQTPKTKASIRIISLDNQTIKVLKQWHQEQVKERNDKVVPINVNNSQSVNDLYLFEGIRHGYPTNFPMSENTANNWNIEISKVAGVKHIKLHGFRHTHASLLFEARIPMEEVKARLGHANIRTTMDVYTHVTKQQKKGTAESFEIFMERA